MHVIGLTGGIAAGKTTVAGILEDNGAVIINADEIARQVMKPRTKTWKEIVRYFGPNVVMDNGTINRRALSRIIFFNSADRRLLDQITHPQIVDEIKKRLKKIGENANSEKRFVVLDIPLLIEAGLTHLTDYIMAVEAENDIRLARLESLGLSFAEALARMEAQISVYERERFADNVIQNNGTPEELRAEVEKCFKHVEKTFFTRRASR